MNKFSNIMLMIWGILALVSFISAFWAPIFFKIIGLTFGGLNMIVILTLVITFFQGVYYRNKLNQENVQLQESETKSDTE